MVRYSRCHSCFPAPLYFRSFQNILTIDMQLRSNMCKCHSTKRYLGTISSLSPVGAHLRLSKSFNSRSLLTRRSSPLSSTVLPVHTSTPHPCMIREHRKGSSPHLTLHHLRSYFITRQPDVSHDSLHPHLPSSPTILTYHPHLTPLTNQPSEWVTVSQ